MWIIIPYGVDEHTKPYPHAHLYAPTQHPTKYSPITKFIISKDPPEHHLEIDVMPKSPEMSTKYGKMIVEWSHDTTLGLNNWTCLQVD
jgi:hypothetical protein